MDSFLNFQFPALNCSEQLEFPTDGNTVFDQLSLSTEHIFSVAVLCRLHSETHDRGIRILL